MVVLFHYLLSQKTSHHHSISLLNKSLFGPMISQRESENKRSASGCTSLRLFYLLGACGDCPGGSFLLANSRLSLKMFVSFSALILRTLRQSSADYADKLTTAPSPTANHPDLNH